MAHTPKMIDLTPKAGETWATGKPVGPGLAELVESLETLATAWARYQDGTVPYDEPEMTPEQTLAQTQVISEQLAGIFTEERVIENALQMAEQNGEDSAEIGLLFERLSRLFGILSGLTLEHSPTPHTTPFTPDAISFINAPIAQTAVRAMWAGEAHWHRSVDQQPYYQDKGRTVYVQAESHFNPQAIDAAWQRVLALDDGKVSTFLICMGKWLADTGGGAKGLIKIRVHASDILSFRGLKKAVHGGYRKEQKEEASADVLAINAIWVQSTETIYEGKGKTKEVSLNSRLLEVEIEEVRDVLGGTEPYAFRIAPGGWATPYLGEHNRYIATLLRPVMGYDPSKQRLAMRLGIYLASQWRNRAHDENYLQPWNLTTLLEGAFVALPTSNPDRFRQQFEQALDQLQADKVIAGWEYENDTELPQRKWLPLWLEWRVKIRPVEAAIERYAKIPQRRREAIARTKRASKAASLRQKPA